MNKLMLCATCALLSLSFASCKDDVYFPQKESNQVADKVYITFDPSLVFPGHDFVGGGVSSDTDENYDPETGNRVIYIFPGDNLGFTLNGVKDTDVIGVDILINGQVIESREEADLTDTISYEIDPTNFRNGKNEITIRYVFPNGSIITRTYYFVVFPEAPQVSLRYEFVPKVSIAESTEAESPSWINVTCSDRDGRIDYENGEMYLMAGSIIVDSHAEMSADGIYGDLWKYELTLDSRIDVEDSNIEITDINVVYNWDHGKSSENFYTVTAPRNDKNDLDWAYAFGVHTVEIGIEYEGYLTVNEEKYYYKGDGNTNHFTILPKAPGSRN